jgi:hypothetical protein
MADKIEDAARRLFRPEGIKGHPMGLFNENSTNNNDLIAGHDILMHILIIPSH